MFHDLEEHPKKVEGVGRLLFEMCKGVRNMFHSCTETVKTRRKESWFNGSAVEHRVKPMNVALFLSLGP